MKKITLAFALTLAASAAHADPDRVSILLGSEHVGASGFNEINPGVFLTWEGSPVDLSVGVYVNSYRRGSVAAMAALPLVEWDQGELSAFVGAAYYPGDGRRFAVSVGDVVPIGGLQVRHGNFFGQVMPSDGNPVDAVVSFGVTFSMDELRRY